MSTLRCISRLSRRRPLLVVITAALLLSQLTGCGSDIVKTPPANSGQASSVVPGKYLFAALYTNYAWAKTNKGLVVLSNGDLYRFDVSATAATLPEQALTDDVALSRYFEAASFEFVKSLNKDQLDTLWRASLPVSNKTLGPQQSICRDAGNFLYLQFQPTASRQQQQVTLYQTGDFRQQQTDERAKASVDYLIKLAVEQKIAWQLDPNGNNWCSGM